MKPTPSVIVPHRVSVMSSPDRRFSSSRCHRPIFLLAATLPFLTVDVAAQSTLYVDPVSGSDSNSGQTQSEPKATLEGVAAAAPPGATTTIVMAMGTYARNESGTVDPAGIPGGNDSDGVALQGDRDLVFVATDRSANGGLASIPAGLTLALESARSARLDVVDESNKPELIVSIGTRLRLFSGRLALKANRHQRIHLKVDGRTEMEGGTLELGTAESEGSTTRLTFEDDVVIGDGALLLFNSGAMLNGGTITNAGTIEFYYHGRLVTPEDVTEVVLLNQAGGEIRFASDGASGLQQMTGGGVLRNEGIIRKTGGNFSSGHQNPASVIELSLINAGIVQSQTGKLQLAAVATEERDGTGVFRVDAGSGIRFGGAVFFASTTTISGAGEVVFSVPKQSIGASSFSFVGTYDVTGDTYVSRDMAGVHFPKEATVASLGSKVFVEAPLRLETSAPLHFDQLWVFDSLYVASDVQADNLRILGYIDGPGDLRVLDSMLWEGGGIGGSGEFLLYGRLDNDLYVRSLNRVMTLMPGSFVDWTDGSLNGQGTIRISPGATFSMLFVYDSEYLGEGITIINNGTFRHARTYSEGTYTVRGPFVNDGTIDLGAKESERPTLEFTGQFESRPGAMITGVGKLSLGGGEFESAGVIQPGDHRPDGTYNADLGKVEILGDYRSTDDAEVQLDVRWDGYESADWDQLIIHGNADLRGKLSVSTDGSTACLPRVGAQFPVMAFESLTGSFQNVNVPTFYDSSGNPDRRTLRPVYSDTSLILEVVASNSAPVAVDDRVEAEENSATELRVLDNDYDPDSDSIQILHADRTAKGGIIRWTQPQAPCWVHVSDLTYRPPLGFTGMDTLTYVIEDAFGALDTASVFITVGTGTRIDMEPSGVPDAWLLSRGYPDPTNGPATISLALPRSADISIVVYDVLGRVVHRASWSSLAAGRHDLVVDLSHVPVGPYLYRVHTSSPDQPLLGTGDVTVLR